MEDWKAAREVHSDEQLADEVKRMSLVGAQDADDSEEDEDWKASKKRFSLRARSLGIADVDNDWDELEAGVGAAKEMAFSLLDKECVAEDVIRVWEHICKFVITKLMEDKAVKIAGLGTFTMRIHKRQVNQKDSQISKVPLFILSRFVADMFQIHVEKEPPTCLPVTPLNLSFIANEAKISKAMVDGILTEILQAFARGIVCNKAIELPFPFIGKLQIRHRVMAMKFYDEFCKKLGLLHSIETPFEQHLVENLIPGRMTPLLHHTPTDTYRSVFHLREVRSVHHDPLLVKLVEYDGKLLPEAIAQKKKNAEGVYETSNSADDFCK